MFEIKTSKEIPRNAKVLAPISMKSKNFTTEKLNTLIDFLKPYNTTLLIADSLQRYNLDDDLKAAKRLGQSVLIRCEKALEHAITIEDNDSWIAHKDEPILKIVCWDTWQIIKTEELNEATIFIASLEKENSTFRDSLNLVVEDVLQKNTQKPTDISPSKEQLIENSISYQKEELAYMLTFSEFTVHLYPDINQSQFFVHNEFKEKFNLPENISFTIEQTLNISFGVGFFEETKKSLKKRPPSFAGRQVFLLCQTYLSSSEISIAEKKKIMDLITNCYEANVRKEETTSKLSFS